MVGKHSTNEAFADDNDHLKWLLDCVAAASRILFHTHILTSYLISFIVPSNSLLPHSFNFTVSPFLERKDNSTSLMFMPPPPPFEKGGAYCVAHVGPSVCRSVCKSPLTLCN